MASAMSPATYAAAPSKLAGEIAMAGVAAALRMSSAPMVANSKAAVPISTPPRTTPSLIVAR